MSTFLVLQQELGAQVGLDPTITSQATLLKRWLNNAQQMVLRAYTWPFQFSPYPLVIQTVTDYTTGTVATTAGSTTITFNAVIAASKTNQFLQTSSSSDWYQITAHTAGTATATLATAAINTAAAATFTIRKTFYSTSTSVDRILQITQDILPYQLIETSLVNFQSYNAGFLGSGTPRIYCVSGTDSTGAPLLRFWPNPDAVVNMSIYFLPIAVDMSADADVSVIPAKWHTTVLIEGAKMQAFNFLDDTRYKDSVVLFNNGIEEMKTEYEVGLRRHRVMTSVDNQPVGGNIGYMPLPFNYPRGS